MSRFVTGLAKALRHIVVWFPAVAVVIHASFFAHVSTVLGRWPQGEHDCWIYPLGDVALCNHQFLATLASLLLPVAVLALIMIVVVAKLGKRVPQVRRRELAIFVLPCVFWIVGVTVSDELSHFYNWYGD